MTSQVITPKGNATRMMSPHAHLGSTRTSCRVKSIMAAATTEIASPARTMTGVGIPITATAYANVSPENPPVKWR